MHDEPGAHKVTSQYDVVIVRAGHGGERALAVRRLEIPPKKKLPFHETLTHFHAKDVLRYNKSAKSWNSPSSNWSNWVGGQDNQHSPMTEVDQIATLISS